MASELSRLIDDELEKVEREGRVNENRDQLRTSLRIKTSPQKSNLDTPALGWRQRQWWTWRRIASALAFGILFVGTFFLLFGPTRTGDPLNSQGISATNTPLEGDQVLEKVPTESTLSSKQQQGSISQETPSHSKHVTKKYPPQHHINQAAAVAISPGTPPIQAKALEALGTPNSAKSPLGSLALDATAPVASLMSPAAAEIESPSPSFIEEQERPQAPTWSKQIGRKMLL